MRTHNIKAILNSAVRVIGLLLFGAVAAFGQAQQVNLTAGPTTLVMPDGTIVPMWGYSCTALAAGVVSTASCANLNPNAPAANPAAVPPTPAGWAAVSELRETLRQLQTTRTRREPQHGPSRAPRTARAFCRRLKGRACSRSVRKWRRERRRPCAGALPVP